MPDNYDNTCSLCGKVIEEVAYHCCSECHKMHREKHKDINEKEGEVNND